MRVADLFAGLGGFSTAACRAGMDVVFAANHWRFAVDIHRRNHPKTKHVCQDLNQFNFALVPDHEILVASPACQGHSEAGQPGRAKSQSAASAHDAMRSTAWAVASCAEAKMPRVVVVENVPEFREWATPDVVLASYRKRGDAERHAMRANGVTVVVSTEDGFDVVRRGVRGAMYRHWKQTFELLGYEVTEQILTASRFGVPQRRRRLFVIASLAGPISLQDPDAEEPPIGDVLDFSAGRWRRIDDVDRPAARRRLEHARKHHRRCWGQHVSHVGAWGRPLSEPSTTVTTKNQHWLVSGDKYRLWSVKETLRAMDFDPNYVPEDAPRSDTLKAAGNAVPVGLGEGVLRAVASAA